MSVDVERQHVERQRVERQRVEKQRVEKQRVERQRVERQGAQMAAAPRRTTRLGIVGAGTVGSTFAYAALMRGAAQSVSLFDINPSKVQAQVLDLAHGIQFMPMARVTGSDDIRVLEDCDVIVFTAGAKQRRGQTRLELADRTVRLVQQVLPRLVEIAPGATHVIVTNPVDVVTYAALRCTGLPPERILGSGTVLDSSRLRFLVAEHAGVAVQSVHAYIAGEHGDSEVPLWSTASIGSVPLLDWAGGAFDETTRRRIHHEVVRSAYRIIDGKGATSFAIGLAATRIVESILADERRVLPVSSLLEDYHGISDLCLSVPTLVQAGGVGERLRVPMTDEELAALRASAESVRATIDRFTL